MNRAKCVIVPDVHGRTFWKDAKDFDCDVIFLGDYLDPYEFEGITKEQAISNFNDILDYAKSNQNVQLLLGNHDLEYAISTRVCECRCDYERYDDIRKMFIDNEELFKFVEKRTYADRDFLFSHAGIYPSWIEKHGFANIDYLCSIRFEKEFEKTHPDFSAALCDVSFWRGGPDQSGSIVWSDIRECHGIDMSSVCCEQIVGHTYLSDKPVGNEWITCIDLQRIFIIDENGNLCNKDFSQINKETWKTSTKK